MWNASLTQVFCNLNDPRMHFDQKYFCFFVFSITSFKKKTHLTQGDLTVVVLREVKGGAGRPKLYLLPFVSRSGSVYIINYCAFYIMLCHLHASVYVYVHVLCESYGAITPGSDWSVNFPDMEAYTFCTIQMHWPQPQWACGFRACGFLCTWSCCIYMPLHMASSSYIHNNTPGMVSSPGNTCWYNQAVCTALSKKTTV